MIEPLIIALAYGLTTYTNHSRPQQERRVLHALMGYHLLFTFAFTYFILKHGGDALAYWQLSTNVMDAPSVRWMDYFGLSTRFVQWLNFWPHHWGWSFLGMNLIYGLMGFYGVKLLYLALFQSPIQNDKPGSFLSRNWWLVLFLPNMHFWTAGLSKEALTLMGLGWVFFGLRFWKSSGWQLPLALGFLFLVRPHIGFLMAGLVFLFFLLEPTLDRRWKTGIAGVGVLGLGLLYPILTSYLVIEDFSWSSLKTLMDFQLDFLHGAEVGSAVDMQQYNLLQRLGTYLFRPLFFDAYNLQTYLASVENLLFVGLSGYGMYTWKKSGFPSIPPIYWIALLFFLTTTFLFANSLANLGIMMRMKSFCVVFYLSCIQFRLKV
ncbi:hypothetical protein KIH41_17740 [Litoribacter ruber]|uniref:hypothetical protein n=1 Tax=Litoribacter ruber TaxID=702568 RepID=UPI001BD9C7EF|nr:hypothetical protein [Litoribacter ruber]MBT0813135.1 hypothetical protein [Litoribacter ruber]